MHTPKDRQNHVYGAIELRYINVKYVCFELHGCPLRAPNSRGQRTWTALHERSKQVLGTRRHFAQHSSNRMWPMIIYNKMVDSLQNVKSLSV